MSVNEDRARRRMSHRHRRWVIREQLWIKQNGLCHYCGCRMTIQSGPPPMRRTDRTIEHVHPLVMGGTWDAENLVLACFACNDGRGRALGRQLDRARRSEPPAEPH